MFPITFQMNNGPKSYQKPCSVPFKNRLNRNKLLATQPPFLKLTPEFSPPTKRMAVGNLPNAPSYCWSPLKLHHEPIKHSLYWSRSDSWKDLRNFNNPWTSSHTEPQVLRFFCFFRYVFWGESSCTLPQRVALDVYGIIFWMVANKTKTANIEELGQLQVSPRQKVVFF